MLFSNLITAIIIGTASLLGLATAGVVVERKPPSGLTSPMKGYAIAEPIISGTIFGQNYTLNGTVQQVYAQLEKIHGADKVAAFYSAANIKAGNTTTATTGLDVTSNLNKRSKIPPALCIPIKGWNWDVIEVAGIKDSLYYLSQTYGDLPVNGHTCTRLSCFEDTGIWLCNDRNEAIAPQIQYLLSYAQDILLRCWAVRIDLHHFGLYSGGQLFDTDNYNVIVRRDNCL